MKCLVCDASTPNKKYCSRTCVDKAKFGRERPDLSARNKNNNPIWFKEAHDRMVKSLTGRKQLKSTVKRRKDAMAKRHELDPTLRIRQSKQMVKFAKNKPLGWGRIRLLALERDNHECQKCGNNIRVVVHHKDHRGTNMPRRKFMNNEMDNLITLCWGCHVSIHTWAVRRAKS